MPLLSRSLLVIGKSISFLKEKQILIHSLFHIIVDNDETASRILEELTKEKGGRVTFMPLNRLHPKQVQYPSGSDVLPMIEKLKFSPIYQKAFMQVSIKMINTRYLSTKPFRYLERLLFVPT